MTKEIQIGAGKRMGYIDAMRGFSMILVVFGHVLLMMGFPTDSSILGSILITFRMPLFFFVSGFFAFRTFEKWTRSFSLSVFKRKFQAQIVCTVVFFSLFQLCSNANPLSFLSEGFSWFWFTICLFQMFLIYMSLALIEKITKKRHIVTSGLLIISAVLLLCHIRSYYISDRLSTIFSWYYLTEYFQFFSAGILARKFFNRFIRLVQSDLFRTVTIIGYIIMLFALYGFNGQLKFYNSAIYNFISVVIIRYAGLFTVFILFYNSKDYFDSNERSSRWLRFVGTRTLDIYMLHVFFLPNLLFLKDFLSGSNMLLIQLAIATVFALLDIIVCLFISSVLRSSNVLSQWLFGVKNKAKTSIASCLP